MCNYLGTICNQMCGCIGRMNMWAFERNSSESFNVAQKLLGNLRNLSMVLKNRSNLK